MTNYIFSETVDFYCFCAFNLKVMLKFDYGNLSFTVHEYYFFGIFTPYCMYFMFSLLNNFAETVKKKSI